MHNQQGKKRIQKRNDDTNASNNTVGRNRGKRGGGGGENRDRDRERERGRGGMTSNVMPRVVQRQEGHQPQLYHNPNPNPTPQLYTASHPPTQPEAPQPTLVRPVILGAKQASDVSAAERKQRRPDRDAEPVTAKFVNEHWNMQTETTAKLMSDTTNFVVVGVLGHQGVGKSTVMSMLYGSKDHSAFTLQTKDHQLLSQHCTTGIDISITPERIVLLDTQAIFSPSALMDMMKSEPPLPAECTSYEHLHELQCIQLAVFLLSVCHVVLVIQDGSCIDWKLWHFLKTATMLKTRIPDPISLGSGPQVINNVTQQQRLRNQLDKIKATLNPQDLFQPKNEYYPDLVFLYNRCPPDLFTSKSLLQLQSTMDKFFEHTPFKNRQPLIQPAVLEEYVRAISKDRYTSLKRQLVQLQNNQTQEESEAQLQGKPVVPTESSDLNAKKIQYIIRQLEEIETPQFTEPHVSFTVLPSDRSVLSPGVEGIELDANICSSSFQASSESFRNKFLTLLCNDKISKRWEGEKITEKEWLNNASKIWGIIRKSPVILDYNKSLTSTNYKSSYYE